MIGPSSQPVPVPPAPAGGTRQELAGLDDRELLGIAGSPPRFGQRRMAACEPLVVRYRYLVRSRLHVAGSAMSPGWRTVRCRARTNALPSGHAGRLSLGKRTGFHGCGAFDNAATQLLETIVLTALPAENSVVTPIGQPRTTRRRREQRPALIPAPVGSFADLGVPAPLVAALGKDGITVPFPVQAATLPDALAGFDILGRAQTGSGKTLAFCIPLVARLAEGYTMACRPRGLVLVPTRELATQVQAVLSPL